MTRLKMLLAGVAGYTLAYFLDPDRGGARRAQLTDQAKSKARDGASAVGAKLRYQTGVARGAMHRMTEPLRPQRDFDDETLIQKVRSEAIGQWQRTVPEGSSGEIAVDASNGTVRLSGHVGRESDRDRLLDMVREVAGVAGLKDKLTVSKTS